MTISLEMRTKIKTYLERMRREKLNGTDTPAHHRRNRLLSIIQPDANSRLSLKKMNAAITSRALGTGSLNSQKEAILSVFRRLAPYDMKIANIVSEVDSCSSYRRCNSKYCPRCSNPRRRWGKRYSGRSNKLRYGYCNNVPSKRGRFSSNYQVRGAQKIIEPFEDLPLCFMHAVTVNLGFIPISGNLCDVSKPFKKRLKKCHIKLSDGSIIAGRLDIRMMYLDEATFTIPNTSKENPYGSSNKHERVAMLHAHFFVFDPLLTRQEVRDVFVDEFPGSKRVCVRTPYNDQQNADGTVTKGAGGYAEYTSIQKTELDFGQDNIAALIEFTGIDGTWDGRSKRISFGKRKHNTETLLDKNILQDYLRGIEGKPIPKNMIIGSAVVRSQHQKLFTTCTQFPSTEFSINRTVDFISHLPEFGLNKLNSFPANYITPYGNWSSNRKAEHIDNVGICNFKGSYSCEKLTERKPP